MDKCFCGADAKITPRQRDLFDLVECRTCGTYLASQIGSLGDRPFARHLLSGVIREAWEDGRVLRVTSENVEALLQSTSIPDGPLEKMDRILLYLARKVGSADQYHDLTDRDYPVAFAHHANEFTYLLEELFDQKLLDRQWFSSDAPSYRLTPEGWNRAGELIRIQRNSSQAFVAMWFDKRQDSIWSDGFQPALKEVGYEPIRVDLVEHNEKICDRIIAEIRRSGLLVADLTGNRGGVYFEAGFAMGLGIPVIWTCSQGDIDNVHLDTRQYNHIVWTDGPDLKKKLVDRIEATLPARTRRVFT